MSKMDSQNTASSMQMINPLFVINLDDSSVINKTLCEISSIEDSSSFIFSKDGLRLLVNGDRTSQVSAFFSSSSFNNYNFQSIDDICYSFLLKDFIEALSLLSRDESDGDLLPKTSLRMYYIKRGDPLKLRLENNTTYAVDCVLKEFSSPSVQTLMSFNEFEETAEIQFNSKDLYKYISGLDLASSAFVKIIMESGDIPVRMQTESPLLGEVELEIRALDSVVYSPLTLAEGRIFNFNYRCKFVAPALEALKSSSYVKMRCGSTGLLLLEHYNSQEAKAQSVQYFVLSEVVI